MGAKFTQLISKEEAVNIIEHALFDERISIEQYEEMMQCIQNLSANRDVCYEVFLNL
jgi:hypothetical protein